ncbi:MAG TPA: glycoside hydrolase family 2 protein [Myxococcota bacterium]|nr:glycoside hydrolase family 2 protein [Myxococcota bacterium]
MLLQEGWTLCSTPAGRFSHPDLLQNPTHPWRPAEVPGTVASTLQLPATHEEDLEALDWWYRCSFAADPALPQQLVVEGLATLAELWLNGVLLLSSRNMFRTYIVQVGEQLREQNELWICFRSVTTELAKKRPRPRWKTALVEAQNLRFLRSSLLGRIPGWTPRLPAIGPWRPLRLQVRPPVEDLQLQSWVEKEGGRLRLRATLPEPDRSRWTGAHIRVGEQVLALQQEEGQLWGDFVLPEVQLWWPHSHGRPTLYDATLLLDGPSEHAEHALGRIGFRAVAFDPQGGRLRVNGQEVFARGACWTAEDLRRLDGSPEALERSLGLARQAGLNLLRIGGTMTYGSDLLYQLCDRLGILVWQDFMFANMDYPFSDPDFLAEVEAEVRGQLRRLQRHPCVVLYCGGSEIQQQAAMLGLPETEWSSPFFDQQLPALCAAEHPGTSYVSGTPSGAPLPFHSRSGLCHYYGVGAYRRPLSDVRAAEVKFTPECLGFSNVPEPELFGGNLPVPHHPDWKRGVPRDAGAGWDFEDIRDHYLRALFSVDPVLLRSTDPERYLTLSRVVPGELMLRAYAEWRRAGSGCGGALLWFWKDLRPGAGWGILDSSGRPKAVWWYLQRAWARTAIQITDEGLNGLDLQLHHEQATALTAQVEVELLQHSHRRVEFAARELCLPPWSHQSLSVEALIGHFSDPGYVYRFGPPRHNLVVARLRGPDGGVLSEDVWFPLGYHLPMVEHSLLQATATPADEGGVWVQVQCSHLLQSLHFSSPGYIPDQNYLHLCPGQPRQIHFRPEGPPRPFKAHLSALNLEGSRTLRL